MATPLSQSLFWPQVKVLLWKSWQIKKNNKGIAVMEICFTLLMVVTMIVMKMDNKDKSYDMTVAQDASNMSLSDDIKWPSVLFVAPNNSHVHSTMDLVLKQLKKHKVPVSKCLFFDKARDIDQYFLDNYDDTAIGVVFSGDQPGTSPNFTLRFIPSKIPSTIDRTLGLVCLDHGAMINESCTPIPHSMRSDVDLHAASPVAQNKQGRVQDLGRGFCPISIIQSPQTSHFATSKQLSILQCNINGLCSTATKIKLEEIMERAEKQKIQIIALQETKLNEKYNLKYKNYNILRKDRNKEGGGLAFLTKNLYYEDIAINIPNTSDLEAQEISIKTKTSSIKEKFWNFKKANWNLYQQNTNEDFINIPTRIKDLEQNWISFKNTIIKVAKVSIPRDYALENTDLNKTPGPDGIHGQMISNLGKNGKEKLLDIFNNSWKSGKLPQDWKTATIIPIKKLDKSADDPKNYRPISLTSICCKLMEKIILRRLTYHLDTRNLLPKEQYGFRKGHGTIDQLLFFTQKVKDAQNRKPTNHTIAAFLDLTQAFDNVWKTKLITKLYKHFKIDGKAITWINDFLKNRYIRVKYNGTLSKTFKLYQGLPQGSVLSPTLFTLFIAGIEENFHIKPILDFSLMTLFYGAAILTGKKLKEI
ncbi:hypothetical protein LAZ67_1000868 [Cordylochernes scorpioides]|uniref:Reverse transcriptase domain-containing protein n=1 Tax=Cordylochernes scorpioides TaxID=51811 RepID=A0ABY6JVR7_9ARAC|nr:hypothetical protein LAZ67_1000868 [Cordylochernes scorpioides]